jgi:hypothetical protein
MTTTYGPANTWADTYLSSAWSTWQNQFMINNGYGDQDIAHALLLAGNKS